MPKPKISSALVAADPQASCSWRGRHFGTIGDVSTSEEVTAAVVARWRQAGSTLAQVRRDELRRLTDAEALVAAEELLDLVRLLPPLTEVSGLVEQQRLFARARP